MDKTKVIVFNTSQAWVKRSEPEFFLGEVKVMYKWSYKCWIFYNAPFLTFDLIFIEDSSGTLGSLVFKLYWVSGWCSNVQMHIFFLTLWHVHKKLCLIMSFVLQTGNHDYQKLGWPVSCFTGLLFPVTITYYSLHWIWNKTVPWSRIVYQMNLLLQEQWSFQLLLGQMF